MKSSPFYFCSRNDSRVITRAVGEQRVARCLPAILFAFLACTLILRPALGQTGQWAWIGGSNLANQTNSTVPGGRQYPSGWTDKYGNFWVFGGGNTNGLPANDLWEFSPSTGTWKLVSGLVQNFSGCAIGFSPSCGMNGVYGTLGVPAPADIPGGREESMAWADRNGDFWIFGGFGYDAKGNLGTLNDLWMFNPTTSQWTWMGGSNLYGGVGVYGTLGIAAGGNIPGARSGSSVATDSRGNIWLFGGGNGAQSRANSSANLNDLWEFSPMTNQWAWMSGSNTGAYYTGAQGVYGTKGVAAPANVPGNRKFSALSADHNDKIWLFGGAGDDLSGNSQFYNDLWEFDPTTLEWTWEAGNDSEGPCNAVGAGPGGPGFTYCAWLGAYGTLGVLSSSNAPGSRDLTLSWTDNQGKMWLFGGQGYANSSFPTELDDLWEFDPVAGEWAWMGGHGFNKDMYGACVNGSVLSCDWPSAYGSEGTFSPGNFPGSRGASTGATDPSGSFWLFGGLGIDSNGNHGELGDLWENTAVSSPWFRFAMASDILNLSSGSAGNITLMVAPVNGFNSTVNFACSGLPSGTTCTFSPSTVTPAGSTVTTQLTIAASSQARSEKPQSVPWFPVSTLAAAGFFVVRNRRRSLQLVCLILLSFVGIGCLSSCGGGGGSATQQPGPLKESVEVRVTATSGPIQQGAVILLTVN